MQFIHKFVGSFTKCISIVDQTVESLHQFTNFSFVPEG
ncbi:Uncharacterised protein [Mycobacterium tuberculosis]|nr:Uncharacterised protein [Mycobacterium tuberculosis]